MWQRNSDKRWCERVQVDGKPKLITAKSEPELKKKLQDINTYASKGRTFEESADLWEEAHCQTVDLKTFQSYKPHIKRAKEHFTGRYMKDITPDEIQAYVDMLAKKRYARDTVHRSLNIVNMIFNHEIVSPGSLIRINPCSAVKLPKNLAKKRREPPTAEQLIKVTPDSEMGLFAFFLQFTGLRRGELLALKWDDIDEKEKVIHVRRVVSYIGNQPEIKDRTKTAAGIRDVALIDILAAALPKERKKGNYIFGGEKPLTNTEMHKRWLSWCRSVGLAESIEKTTKGKNGKLYKSTIYKPLVTPHQFRHEYASMLEEAGISEFAAKNLLGHSSIIVTKDIYTHIKERKAGKTVTDTLNKYLTDKEKVNNS